MGGYGSTRWGSVRVRHTVDMALSLPIGYFRWWDMSHRQIVRAEIDWHNSRGVNVARAIWQLDTTDQDAPFIDITIIASGLHTTCVYLQSSPCNFGGQRWFMICPKCARRVTAVHLPPYRSYTRFLCRYCHDLSYNSAQTAHDNDRGAYAGIKMLLDAKNRIDTAYDILKKIRSHSKKVVRVWHQIEKYERIAHRHHGSRHQPPDLAG